MLCRTHKHHMSLRPAGCDTIITHLFSILSVEPQKKKKHIFFHDPVQACNNCGHYGSKREAAAGRMFGGNMFGACFGNCVQWFSRLPCKETRSGTCGAEREQKLAAYRAVL